MTTPETTPPRMNAATLALYQHEERMAQAARFSEPSVSVECDDTAKGDTTPTVKLYAPLGCDLHALEAHAREVARIAVQVHKDTRAAFPRSNGAA
jgi:hypothetical protein